MIALHLHNCTTREIYQHFWTAKSAKQIVCRTATVTHWSSYHRQHHKCVGRIKSFIIKINHNSHSVPRSLKKKKSHKNLSAANLAFSLKNEYQIKREPTAGPEPKRRLSGTKIAQNNVLHSEFFYMQLCTDMTGISGNMAKNIHLWWSTLPFKRRNKLEINAFYASCKEKNSWSNSIQLKEQGFFQKVTL